jgi:hypothetical protein
MPGTENIAVNADTLRQVARDVSENRVALAEQALHIEAVKEATKQTATDTARLADIAEERLRMEKQDRQDALARQESEASASRETKALAAKIFSENWRFFALIALVIAYPQFAPLLAPGVSSLAPASASPVAVPPALPVAPLETEIP